MSRSIFGYGHDKANRMTTQAAVSQGYDLRGNLTLGYSADRSSSYTYSYDHNNRITEISAGFLNEEAYIKYDALGRRIAYYDYTANGGGLGGDAIHYFYDGTSEIAEFIQSTLWGGSPPGRVVRCGVCSFAASAAGGGARLISHVLRRGLYAIAAAAAGGAKFGTGISPSSFSTHRLGCQVHGITPLGLNGGWGLGTRGRSRARSTLG